MLTPVFEVPDLLCIGTNHIYDNLHTFLEIKYKYNNL